MASNPVLDFVHYNVEDQTLVEPITDLDITNLQVVNLTVSDFDTEQITTDGIDTQLITAEQMFVNQNNANPTALLGILVSGEEQLTTTTIFAQGTFTDSSIGGLTWNHVYHRIGNYVWGKGFSTALNIGTDTTNPEFDATLPFVLPVTRSTNFANTTSLTGNSTIVPGSFSTNFYSGQLASVSGTTNNCLITYHFCSKAATPIGWPYSVAFFVDYSYSLV